MQENPYQTPSAAVEIPESDEAGHWIYAGFWIRVGAAIIDSLLIIAVTYPILGSVYGAEYFTSTQWIHGPVDFLLSWVFPIVAIITFWIYRSATPGKMALKLVILDAKTGEKPSIGQFLLRYLGYYIASIPLLLGIIWVAFDPRKQGWHDKIAGTVVIRPLPNPPQSAHPPTNPR